MNSNQDGQNGDIQPSKNASIFLNITENTPFIHFIENAWFKSPRRTL